MSAIVISSVVKGVEKAFRIFDFNVPASAIAATVWSNLTSEIAAALICSGEVLGLLAVYSAIRSSTNSSNDLVGAPFAAVVALAAASVTVLGVTFVTLDLPSVVSTLAVPGFVASIFAKISSRVPKPALTAESIISGVISDARPFAMLSCTACDCLPSIASLIPASPICDFKPARLASGI